MEDTVLKYSNLIFSLLLAIVGKRAEEENTGRVMLQVTRPIL